MSMQQSSSWTYGFMILALCLASCAITVMASVRGCLDKDSMECDVYSTAASASSFCACVLAAFALLFGMQQGRPSQHYLR